MVGAELEGEHEQSSGFVEESAGLFVGGGDFAFEFGDDAGGVVTSGLAEPGDELTLGGAGLFGHFDVLEGEVVGGGPA